MNKNMEHQHQFQKYTCTMHPQIMTVSTVVVAINASMLTVKQ